MRGLLLALSAEQLGDMATTEHLSILSPLPLNVCASLFKVDSIPCHATMRLQE
jgi:hypothetical protein